MPKSRNKKQTHTIYFWSKGEFLRFTTAVERLVTAIADLETLLQQPKARAAKAAATRKAKEASAEARAELQRLNAAMAGAEAAAASPATPEQGRAGD